MQFYQKFHQKYRELGLVLALVSGCANSSAESSTLIETVGIVVDGTREACNYIPTVTSVASILGVPGAPAASELVKAICTEVDSVPVPESGRNRSREIRIELPQGNVEGVLLPS